MNNATSPIPIASPTAKPAVPRQSELLRNFLAGRDVRCPTCEYNLRDLSSDRCPECGDTLTLRVNTPEPPLAVLIAGLIGLSIGTGFSAILSVIFIVFRFPALNEDRARLPLCIASAVLGGLLIAAWLRSSRRLRRLRRKFQWILAATCWALSAGTVSGLVLFTLMTM